MDSIVSKEQDKVHEEDTAQSLEIMMNEDCVQLSNDGDNSVSSTRAISEENYLNAGAESINSNPQSCESPETGNIDQRGIFKVSDSQEITLEGKVPSDGESSPPMMDDNLGRRKRKPSRYHDSMFDIPTNLMNINRTINPEEFRAFHSKSGKQKEKLKKPTLIPTVVNKPPKLSKMDADAEVSEAQIVHTTIEAPPLELDPKAMEDDVLDSTKMFKFKMRRDHVIQNTLGGPSAYRCDICMMTFPRSFSLRRHYTRRHINPIYVLPKSGSICITDAEQDMTPHPPLADVDGAEESQFLYACKMCTKELLYFKHKNDLRVHCLENHNSEPRRPVTVFKCELCKRSYSTRHELQRHKRTHSGERPYACGYCHKTFPTSTNARRHERTHTGDRPHICKVCNKGFIQRTDMVKHLRSIHKMKVTKTKAERGGPRKPTYSQTLVENWSAKTVALEGKDGENGMDSSNEFHENIDFAAYLKLDEHDSGTLMGEKALPRGPLGPFLGKEQQSNNSNNCQVVGPPDDLRNLPPSEVMGEDGRPEKCHRCPECSKMFSSNINLRRHYKLKHERNQLYQCAEPVSMVVEKYKIKDEVVGAVLENQVEENLKEINGAENSGLDYSTEKVTNLELGPSDEVLSLTKNEVKSDTLPSTSVIPTKMSTSERTNKISKGGKLSKLSSIVQRLADKKSAEQPTISDLNHGSSGTFMMVNQTEMQPIKQLEDLESQVFKRSFSPEISELSTKRNKRKRTSVHQVKLSREYDNPGLGQEEFYKRNIDRGNEDYHDPTTGGIYQKVFQKDDIRGSFFPHLKPSYSQDIRWRSDSPPHRYYQSSTSQAMPALVDERLVDSADISKSFASFTPDSHHDRSYIPRSPIRDPEVIAEKSRIEAFLTQCLSSKKRDIPKNAILDKNMPTRDANAMNRKLKYDMRHLPSERANEHLPPSAYFSNRDSLPNVKNVISPPPVPRNFGKNEQNMAREIKAELPFEGDFKAPGTGDDSPLDLRVPSKKLVQDYVVRDDGVLDFSRKTRDTLSGSSNAQSKTVMPTQTHVKTEPGMHGSLFHDRKPPMSFSVQHYDEIPPWLRSSHQKFLSGSSGPMRPPVHHQIPEHRREILHGRPSSTRPRKPYKFHAMEFNPSNYQGGDVRKSVPPHMLPFRDHSYMPPPRGMKEPFLSRYGRTPPMADRPRGGPPHWRGNRDDGPYHSDRMPGGHPGHKHFPSSPPCSICNMGPMPSTHHPRNPPPHRNPDKLNPRDHLTKPPHPLKSKNWPFNPRHEHLLHAKAKPPDSRTIFMEALMKENPEKFRSPFNTNKDLFADKDMMNRCIKKAQQALQGNRPHDTVKRNASGQILQSASSVFKSNPTATQNMQKPITSPPSASNLATSSSLKSPQNTSIIQKNAAFLHGVKSEFENMSTSGETAHAKSITDSPLPAEQVLKTDTNEEELSARNENHQDDTSERQKLTMTPGLESTNEDVAEIEKTENSVSGQSSRSENSTKSVANNGDNTEAVFLKLKDNGQNELACIPMDIGNKADENLRPKSCDIPFESAKSHSLKSPDVSMKTKSASLSPESLNNNSSKILHRRHTHAHQDGTNKPDFLSGRNILKRSTSSDSPQQTMSDDGEETPKKTIKKLKLRVIKSPGSENKKCWTLVEQDAPKFNATKNETLDENEEDNRSNNELSDKDLEEESALVATEGALSKSNPDDTSTILKESESIENEEQVENHQKNAEKNNQEAVKETMVKDVEKPANTDSSDSNTTTQYASENILTGSHVENALSAIAVSNENNSDTCNAQSDTVVENSSKLSEDSETEKVDEVVLDLKILKNDSDVTPDSKPSAQKLKQVKSPSLKEPGTLETEKPVNESDTQTDVAKTTTNLETVATKTELDSEKQSQSRTTRSGVFNVAVNKTEKKSVAIVPKNVELSPPAGSVSSKLRRSIRIRKSSSDKDTTTKKKEVVKHKGNK